jgi:transcriptional regulator GlxA family with amidase domain
MHQEVPDLLRCYNVVTQSRARHVICYSKAHLEKNENWRTLTDSINLSRDSLRRFFTYIKTSLLTTGLH